MCEKQHLTGNRLTPDQKAADFEHLFQVIRDNHPFICLKARVEGYDWLAHYREFRSLVKETRDDREFARAIRRILLLINNGHTGIAGRIEATLVPRPPGVDDNFWDAWAARFEGIDPDVAERWQTLSREPEQREDTFPSMEAVYSGGDYVVVGVAPALEDTVDIQEGLLIEKVNGQDVHDYVAGLRGTGLLKYDPIRKRLYQGVLLLPEGTVRLGLVNLDDTRRELSIPGRTGQYRVAWTRSPVLDMAASGNPYPRTAGNLYSCLLKDGRGDNVAYLRVASMTFWSDRHKMEQETALLKAFFHDIKEVPALIIDIRGNPGGQDPAWHRIVSLLASEELEVTTAIALRDGALARPFAEWLESRAGAEYLIERSRTHLKLPAEVMSGAFRNPFIIPKSLKPDEESIRYRGKVFLLVDDRVFSAAESFAVFCKWSGFATLVGSHTGGDGIGWESLVCRLPHSGLVFIFPMAMGINPDMTVNEEVHTLPHVLVEQTVEDLLKAAAQDKPAACPDPGSDTVLRKCLELAGRGNAI